MNSGVYIVSTLKANQWVKLTKTVIDNAPVPARGQTFLRDAEIKGFGVRITAQGARAFIVEKRIAGQVRRVTLGRYGELTLQQARLQAQKLLGQIAMGHNPIADKHRARLEAITLQEAFQDFVRARTSLKDKTLYDYRRYLETAFADWQRRPLIAITKDHIAALHQQLGTTRGEYYANGAMRFLRSLLNFAMAQYEDSTGRGLFSENPVLRLTRARSWFRTERRRTVLTARDLAPWVRAVSGLRSDTPDPFAETVGDYLMLLLLTGLRRQEAAQLLWTDIDFHQRTLTIRDPKNREPHTLPLSDHLEDLLARRSQQRRSAYVFDGTGKKGYLIEPKRWIARVQTVSGVTFTLHDLRRTFATIAEGLEIPPYTLKRLLNHKMRQDVTAGYIVSDMERLRGPMQKITDYVLKVAGVRATPIIPLGPLSTDTPTPTLAR